MVPRYVEFRDELPVNTSGKIARRELTQALNADRST
jgi:acyl-coenzyme A synthetase/AMP-(fatty) acid ligase